MSCLDQPKEFGAYVDGQLDVRTDVDAIARVATHIAHCESCRAELAVQQEFSQRVRAHASYHSASDLLRARVQNSVRDAFADAATPTQVQTPESENNGVRSLTRRSNAWRSFALAASVLLAAVATHDLIGRRSVSPFADRSLVAAHTRSLNSARLIDVASSDRHTVKPWFEGKIDFSPPVFDLADAGFPLIGGRVDSIDTHAAAALVFRRGQHTINLFVTVVDANANAPSGATAQAGALASFAGIQVVHWQRGEFSFAAVSALNGPELSQFAKLYRERDMQP